MTAQRFEIVVPLLINDYLFYLDKFLFYGVLLFIFAIFIEFKPNDLVIRDINKHYQSSLLS